MKVILAGYNVDTNVLGELQDRAGRRDDVTPEVLSAAYARISRDRRPIDEIRRDAREEVERARRSNSTIIFKMGHHSVAEHAVFNLDILGVSRYIMEEVEKFRLSSYTEKSQRYITLDKDFVIPAEIAGTRFEPIFVDTIGRQNDTYFKLYNKLREYVFSKHARLAEKKSNHSMLEGWAKEDARYVTALATESQVGMTVNARNLELLLRRFASHSLEEVRELGRRIYEQISGVAPSIVIFHAANDYDRDTRLKLKQTVAGIFPKTTGGRGSAEVLPEPAESRKDAGVSPEPAEDRTDDNAPAQVQLVEYTPDADLVILASLLHASSGRDYHECKAAAAGMDESQRLDFLKTAWENMQLYDSVLREFEYAHLTFDLIVSAACFGQLKRHRMATITTQSYDPRLGVAIPESITAIGERQTFMDVMARTAEVYESIRKEIPAAAPYILTNAHRKRVLMRFSVRELYHISRLREDAHAQWDIQRVARAMGEQARRVMPLACGLLGGKDQYNRIYEKTFGRPPRVQEVKLPGARKIK
jgi:flavin-dependent thymidylate synthase